MAYRPIEPNAEFNQDEFKNARKNVLGLEGSLENLVQDPFNPQVRAGLGGLIYDSPEHFAGIAPDTVRGLAGPIAKEGRSKLEEYALNHSEEIYAGIDSGMYLPLLMKLNLPEERNGDEVLDTDYNKFVKAVKKVKKLQKAVSEGDKDEIVKAVGEILNYDGWKSGIAYAAGDSSYLNSLARDSSGLIEGEMNKLLINEAGDGIDNEKVQTFFRKSYDLARVNEDKKYFSEIANIAYQQQAA